MDSARPESSAGDEMGEDGVVFADGIESDRIEFLSGQVLQVGLAERKLNLVVPAETPGAATDEVHVPWLDRG